MALEVIKQINEELSALKEELKTMKGSTEELKTLSDKIADLERKKEFYEPKIDKDEVIKAEKKAADLVLKAKILGRPVDSFEEYKEVAGVVEKAIKPSDINNWLDEAFSRKIIEKLELEPRVESLFNSITIPEGVSTLSIPQNSGGIKSYLIQPAQDAIESALTAGKVTFNLSKIKNLVIVSDEAANESVVSALMTYLQGQIAKSIAEGIDEAIVSGDPTGAVNDSPSATDVRSAFKGLRAYGKANVVDAGGGSITFAKILEARKSMGVYGVNPNDLVLLVNPDVYYQILGLSEVVTQDRFGNKAVIHTGSVAKIGGVDIVMTPYLPTNMNATGDDDSSTPGTKTGCLLLNTRYFTVAKRDTVAISKDTNIVNDTSLMSSRVYRDFKKVAVDDNVVSYLVNIAP